MCSLPGATRSTLSRLLPRCSHAACKIEANRCPGRLAGVRFAVGVLLHFGCARLTLHSRRLAEGCSSARAGHSAIVRGAYHFGGKFLDDASIVNYVQHFVILRYCQRGIALLQNHIRCYKKKTD